MKPAIVDNKAARAFPVDMVRAFNLRKGDLVQVLYGRDKGNHGVVRDILRNSNQLIVSGCNVVKSYRPSEAEKQINPQLPGFIALEAPIHVTNVAPLDPVTKKPTRIKLRCSMMGECVRISKLSGCAIPDAVSTHPVWSDRALRRKAILKSGFLRGSPVSDRALSSWKTHNPHYSALVRFSKLH
jgi:ribosomal protein L24